MKTTTMMAALAVCLFCIGVTHAQAQEGNIELRCSVIESQQMRQDCEQTERLFAPPAVTLENVETLHLEMANVRASLAQLDDIERAQGRLTAEQEALRNELESVRGELEAMADAIAANDERDDRQDTRFDDHEAMLSVLVARLGELVPMVNDLRVEVDQIREDLDANIAHDVEQDGDIAELQKRGATIRPGIGAVALSGGDGFVGGFASLQVSIPLAQSGAWLVFQPGAGIDDDDEFLWGASLAVLQEVSESWRLGGGGAGWIDSGERRETSAQSSHAVGMFEADYTASDSLTLGIQLMAGVETREEVEFSGGASVSLLFDLFGSSSSDCPDAE